MGTNARIFDSRDESVTVTIANGASLSGAADINGAQIVGLRHSSAWTAAAISFTVSNDNSTFYPLYDATAEVTIASGILATGEARCFALDPIKFRGWRYVKVRSGVNGAAVNQGADRVVTLIAKPVDPVIS